MIKDTGKFKPIPLEQLELWEEANVRKHDALQNIEDLAGSIQRNGLRMPLFVKKGENNYLVFSGQRRLEACRIARLEEVPCFVFEKISLIDARILSLSENLYRESMTKEDKSRAAVLLFEYFKDIDKVAHALGVKPNTVKGYFAYDDIPEELKKFARKDGNLTPKQVEDIYMKFPDMKRALTIANKLSSIKERNAKHKFHAAIRQAAPFDDLKTITERADKLIHMKKYVIHLPDADYKEIEKVASARKIDEEGLLLEIIENWIKEFLRR